MEVEVLTPIGVQIRGVRIQGLTRSGYDAAVVPLLRKHGLVIFKDQEDTTPEELLRFALMHPDADHEAAAYNPFAKGDPSCLPGLPMARELCSNPAR